MRARLFGLSMIFGLFLVTDLVLYQTQAQQSPSEERTIEVEIGKPAQEAGKKQGFAIARGELLALPSADAPTSPIGFGGVNNTDQRDPLPDLQIHEPLSGNAEVWITNDTDGDSSLWFSTDYSGLQNWSGVVFDHSDDALKLFNADNVSDHLVIANDGNVGIGTTNPLAKLDIYNGSIRVDVSPSIGGDANVSGANYPIGLSYTSHGAGSTGWPQVYATTFTVKQSNSRMFQLDVHANDPGAGTYMRAFYTSSWSPFRKIHVEGENGVIGNAIFAGNVGIGTTNPLAKLDIYDGSIRVDVSPSIGIDGTVSGGNYPSGLSYTSHGGGSTGWPQVYATTLTVKQADSRMFQLDVHANDPGAGTYLRAFYNTDWSPFRKVHVEGENGVIGNAIFAGNVGIGTPNPTNILTIAQGSATDPIADAWTTYSSKRWKTNIKPLENALDKVQRLRGVSYDWKADGKHDIGLIAEEVGAVMPEVVAFEANGVDAKSVDYARLVAVLIEAVKTQQQMIDEQNSELTQLKAENVEIRKTMGQFSSSLKKLEGLVTGVELSAQVD